MEKTLTSLERKALSNNIGREEARFLICAVSPLGTEYSFIDCFKFCTERDNVRKLKKELKTKFPKDNIKVLIIRVRRIE